MTGLSRRRFLGLAGAASLAPLAARLVGAQPSGRRPNFLILLFDTFAAAHAGLYGYGRATTPRLNRLAERAIVYHRHYAGGNYTTTGTASLLTGTYPWRHRAFNIGAETSERYARRSIFHALSDYHRQAFTQNSFARFFLNQFSPAIDNRLPPGRFALGDPLLTPRFLGRDEYIALHTERLLQRPEAESLLLSRLAAWRRERVTRRLQAAFAPGSERPLPHTGVDIVYRLPEVVDGIGESLARAPEPFFAYHHLWPPHAPYAVAHPFETAFAADTFVPPDKPLHPLYPPLAAATVAAHRRHYDALLRHVDAELGRLVDVLEASGLLDNTYLIITSDHGEMFERGVVGHTNILLYEALIHIPLLIIPPVRTTRTDIRTPTSCIDLVPTLAHLAGRPSPTWAEGRLLPPFGSAQPDRPIFAVDARLNSKWAPLTETTVAVVQGNDKLIYYQYEGQSTAELYDLAADPDELVDLAAARPARRRALEALVRDKLATATV